MLGFNRIDEEATRLHSAKVHLVSLCLTARNTGSVSLPSRFDCQRIGIPVNPAAPAKNRLSVWRLPTAALCMMTAEEGQYQCPFLALWIHRSTSANRWTNDIRSLETEGMLSAHHPIVETQLIRNGRSSNSVIAMPLRPAQFPTVPASNRRSCLNTKVRIQHCRCAHISPSLSQIADAET
jgi:hypothetical protein